jgi:hypothetical protein
MAKQTAITNQKEINKDVNVAPVSPEELKKRKHEADRKRGNQKVKCKFVNHLASGAPVHFTFRKWKGDPITKHSYYDGEVAYVSRDVIKHINRNARYPVHRHATDAKGRPSSKIGRYIQRYSFYPMEFTDTSDPDSADMVPSPDIVTIENV